VNGQDAEVVIKSFQYLSRVRKAAIDIKPQSCPNPLNLNSKGVLPVAVLGTGDFNVYDIDPTTILLSREDHEGIAPIRWNYEDVATPFGGELCDCHDLDGDGYLDLTLEFNTKDLIEAQGLGECERDEMISLTITGNLYDEAGGTQIQGSDCIKVLKPEKKKK